MINDPQCEYRDESGRQCVSFAPHDDDHRFILLDWSMPGVLGGDDRLLYDMPLQTIFETDHTLVWFCPGCASYSIVAWKSDFMWELAFENRIELHELYVHNISPRGEDYRERIWRIQSKLHSS